MSLLKEKKENIIDHLFICPSTYWVTLLLTNFAHFSIDIPVFFLLICLCSWYVSDISPGSVFFLLFCFVFLGPHLHHMDVPRLGVESKLQLPAYAMATATPDLSCICNLHHSSQQHRILDPLSRNRNQACVLMDTSRVCSTEPQQEILAPISFNQCRNLHIRPLVPLDSMYVMADGDTGLFFSKW